MSTPATNRTQRTAPPGPTRRELRAHPAVRNYLLLCLGALLLVVVCLVDRGLDMWSLLPALIGVVSLLAEWTMGPPLLLVSLTGLLLSGPRYHWGSPYWGRNQMPTLMELVLAASVLGYSIAHYRYLALVRHIFPPDPRTPRGERTDPGRRRAANRVDARELPLVILTSPLWVGLSFIVWSWALEDAALDIPKDLWRMLRIVWAALALLGGTALVYTYLRQAAATPEEALIYSQDEVWRATRREQSHLNRWLYWSRLRGERKKESS